MNRELLKQRSKIINGIRRFFNDRDYLEVETPLLAPGIIPESHIEVFETRFIHPFKGEMPLFLLPSPEYYMKKLLLQGSGDIYQIGKSFRNAENIGRIHNPEFTMLEWYTLNADYHDSMDVCEELIKSLWTPEASFSLENGILRLSMDEAFKRFAGFSLIENTKNLYEKAVSLGMNSVHQNDDFEVLFHKIFLTFVEPELEKLGPVFIHDYPAGVASLSRGIPGTPLTERFELYINGVELANCYTEAMSRNEMQAYIKNESSYMEHRTHQIDFSFADSFPESGIGCSGLALGVDRLVMLLLGRRSLEGVILFPTSDIIT